MKKLLIAFLATAAALATAPYASAGPITGAVTIFGFDSWHAEKGSCSGLCFTNPGLGVGSGTLAAIDGGVTLANFSLSGNNAGDGVKLFSGADGISLTIKSDTIVSDTKNFLNITGTGWLTENGDTGELVDWSLTSTNTGAVSFTIDADGTPEPSTLLLLGTGLLGLAFVISRKSKSKPVSQLKLSM